jgi:ABC-2 type transport system permease protein
MTPRNIFQKKNRALLAELVRTDFKLRYQGSALGYVWSLLRPLLMFLILYIVFSRVFNAGDTIPNYPIYLLLGIVLWSFFTEMTSQSLTAIVARGDLIRKIKIPRWLIIVSVSLSALINLCLNLVIVFVFAYATKLQITASALLLPFYIGEVYVFALALSLLLSALYVRYRDISYIWDVVLQAGFYATPIIYPLSLISSPTLQRLILSNPIAQAIQGAREIFVTRTTITTTDAYGTVFANLLPFGIIIVFLLIGQGYFRRRSQYFAEDL